MIYTTHKKNLAKLPENSIKLIVMRVPSGINFISNTNIYWKPELSPNKDLMYKFKFEKKISFDDFEKEFKKQQKAAKQPLQMILLQRLRPQNP